MLKKYFICLVICLEAPELISQRILPDNLEGARVVFCKESHRSRVAPGGCPNSPGDCLPNPAVSANYPAAPANTEVTRVFRPLFSSYAPLREGVNEGIGVLFQGLLVSISPTQLLFPLFQPEFHLSMD